MDDYALVLNAGSSSLKFCVFERPPGESWHLEARGQVEGIGTSPRLSVKDENGESLANQDVAAHDGREALDALADWLRSKYGRLARAGCGSSRGPWGCAVQWSNNIECGCDARTAPTSSTRSASSTLQPCSHRSSLRTFTRNTSSRLLRYQLSSWTTGSGRTYSAST